MDGGVGNKLREARARRRLSLQEAEEATKIRARFLQEIESEDWDQLPGDTYTRAFIRTYGALLGLDGDRLAEEHRKERGAARPGERLPRVDPGLRRIPQGGRRRRISPRFLAIAVSALVVAALLVIGLAMDGGSDDAGDGSGRAEARRQAPPPHIGEAIPVR